MRFCELTSEPVVAQFRATAVYAALGDLPDFVFLSVLQLMSDIGRGCVKTQNFKSRW